MADGGMSEKLMGEKKSLPACLSSPVKSKRKLFSNMVTSSLPQEAMRVMGNVVSDWKMLSLISDVR